MSELSLVPGGPMPKNAQAEVETDYWAIFDLPEAIEPGLDAVKLAQARIDAFATRWRDFYPAAVRCLLDAPAVA
jgi:putative transposase